MKEKVLFLGSVMTCPEMIAHCRKLGYYIIAADYLPKEESISKMLADESWDIDLKDLDALEAKCREAGVTRLLAGISEFCLDKALALSERLSIPWYCTKETWAYARDKGAFKRLCRENGMKVAEDYTFSETPTEEELAKVVFPVVVKPVDKCSNIGLHICHNQEELLIALEDAKSISVCGRVVVERYIVGADLMGMYALSHGEMAFLGLAWSYCPSEELSFCYCVNTNICPYLGEYLKETDPAIQRVFRAAGCREGFVWSDMRTDEINGGIYALEMGYRLAGDLTFIPMKDVNHLDGIEWMTDYMLGRGHSPEELPKLKDWDYKKCACSYILWSSHAGTVSEIRGLEEVKGLLDLSYTYDSPAGAQVGAFRPILVLFFCADNAEEMCRYIRVINEHVEILDENGENMYIRYDRFEPILSDYARMMESCRSLFEKDPQE